MRFPRIVLLTAALSAAALGGVPPASAGWDDFEFGQKLIEKGYRDYAQRVFQSIVDDSSRPQVDRDRAKFGLALLGKAEFSAAKADERVAYADVKAKYVGAVSKIQEFVEKYPSDLKADDARSEMAGLHLEFTQFGSDLARNAGEDEGPCGAAAGGEKKPKPLEVRRTTSNEVLADIQNSVRHAEEIFNSLRQGAKSKEMQGIAAYYFVVCKYYKGLASPPCSQPANEALRGAVNELDDYATTNEQYLTGAWAMDYLGLAKEEIADCEGNDDAAKALYTAAFQAFQACSDMQDNGDEYRKVICRGFFHMGHLANSVKERPWTREFQRNARKALAGMEKTAPRAVKMQDGIQALIEWALLEANLGDPTAAIGILKRASEFAADGGFGGVVRRANSMVRCVLAKAGTTGFEADPSVIQKVADDLFSNGEFLDAVPVYRQVIAAAPQTRDGLVKYTLPSWKRIGDCYRQAKPPLLLEAALAYDAIVDEIRAGRIECTSEADPIALAAQACYNYELSALNELVKVTGDAVVRERLNNLTVEGPKLCPMGGSGGDRMYTVARQLFDQAKKEKEQGVATFKATFEKARQAFQEVAKSSDSDWQDNALQYLVQIWKELESWPEAVAEADKAFATWDAPEAKAREKDDAFLAKRRVQKAWVGYWKAFALGEMNRDDDLLAWVDGFEQRFPGASVDTTGRVKGLHVDALVSKGRIEEAEKVLEQLERENPDYYGLGGVLVKVASHYKGIVQGISKKIVEVATALNGTAEDASPGLKRRIPAAVAAENQAQDRVTDIRATVDRAYAEKRAADSETNEAERDKKRNAAEKAIRENEPRLKEAEEALQKARETREALQKQADELVARRQALEKEEAPSLRKLAALYRRIDEIMKDLDAADTTGKKRRQADFVYQVATQYYALARVEVDVLEDWKTVRTLFEDYLAFPDVKAAPDTEDHKRTASSNLGTALVRLAEAAATPEEARTLYSTAVRYLEAGIAKVAVNTPMIVAHLAGETVTLAYMPPAPMEQVTWRIPFPKLADVKAFREYVVSLGPDRLPRYLSDKQNDRFMKAIQKFQEVVHGLADADVDRTVKSLKEGGFDPVFFGEHAWTEPERLLTLSRAYLRSGLKENAVRASNAAKAVIKAANVEGDGPQWWEAYTIILETSIAGAERAVKESGDQSPDARKYAKEADSTLSTVKSLYPTIGGAERHEVTLKDWKALQQRLRVVLSTLRMPITSVDLESAAPAAPKAPEAPPTPPSGAPSPPAMGN